jgi:hypothetical protein
MQMHTKIHWDAPEMATATMVLVIAIKDTRVVHATSKSALMNAPERANATMACATVSKAGTARIVLLKLENPPRIVPITAVTMVYA